MTIFRAAGIRTEFVLRLRPKIGNMAACWIHRITSRADLRPYAFQSRPEKPAAIIP